MTNIDFEEFQEKNGHGSAEKYRKNKNIIHNKKNKKYNTYDLTDWKKESEHYINHMIYDIGQGKFTFLGNLNNQLNKQNS